MPANLSALNAAIAALTTEVANTETGEDSAVALINGFATAIADALTADNALDEAATAAAAADVETVRARFAASGAKLAAAVAAVPGTPTA